MPPAEPARIVGTSRPLPRALVAIAALLLVARVATGVWEDRHRPVSLPLETQTVGQDHVAWVESVRATELARQTGKPILYDFSAEWCGPCRMMAAQVFADAGAAAEINRRFVPVHVVDRQREEGANPPEVERLQRAYSIEAFPTLVIASPDNPHFETISGYRGRDGTVAWLAGSSMLGHPRPGAQSADPNASAPGR